MLGRAGGAFGSISGDTTGEDERDLFGGRKAIGLPGACATGTLRGGGSFKGGAGALAASMNSAMENVDCRLRGGVEVSRAAAVSDMTLGA